jgi:hypothetical protein
LELRFLPACTNMRSAGHQLITLNIVPDFNITPDPRQQ